MRAGGVFRLTVLCPNKTQRAGQKATGQVQTAPCQHIKDQPLKPIATTNFSELSDRLEGGLTFITLVNLVFNSF